MPNIAIVADSTCDIPADLREKHNIYVVPLHLIWGQEDLLDGPDLTATDFYNRLVTDSTQPSTSAPSVGEFVTVFESARRDGAEEILTLTLSKGLSSTYTAAQLAIAEVGFPIQLRHTGSTSMGGGWQVLRAAQTAQQGAKMEEIIARVEEVRRNSVVLLSVDTLEYLHRGGRIGGAAKWIGTMLNLKPLLRSNLESGEVEPVKAVRTRPTAINTLYNTFLAKVQDISVKAPVHAAVIHAAAESEANTLAERLGSIAQIEEALVLPGSPVLGMHTGPGTLAICGYVETER